MKTFVDVMKAACSVGSAIVIYLTVMRAIDGDGAILIYILASVFSFAAAVSFFCISSLLKRVERAEKYIGGLIDDGYDEEDEAKRECPYCHAFINESAPVCPYCGDGTKKVAPPEVFATEDPNYNGTDYSEEEPLSAHVQDAGYDE